MDENGRERESEKGRNKGVFCDPPLPWEGMDGMDGMGCDG